MNKDKKQQSATMYDFSHPGHKLNKQWPILDLVSARIASSFGLSLSSKLQINLEGLAVKTTRSKYSECVAGLAPTCIVNQVSLSPLQGVIWFCMDISVLAAIVDGYFGGEAILTPEEEPRELSRTEKRVAQHVLDALATSLSQGWSMVMPLNVSMTGAIDVERLVNSPQEQVMVNAQMNLQQGALELPCQIVYPFEMLKPIGDRLVSGNTAPTKQDVQFSQAMQAELMNCELDIRGVLSEAPITLGKVLQLKPGDFIPLRDVQNVSFKSQNMPLFDARIGISNGRVSASLSRWHLPVNN